MSMVWRPAAAAPYRRPLTCGAFDESGRVGYRFKARVSYTLLLLPTGLSSPEVVTPAGSDRIWMPEFQGVVETR
jgi:hypothetical protein